MAPSLPGISAADTVASSASRRSPDARVHVRMGDPAGDWQHIAAIWRGRVRMGGPRPENARVRVLLLVNQSATSVTARTRVMIHTEMAQHHDVEVAFTSRRGHAARLARGAVSAGMEAVVVLGGDGTVNEAANGLVGSSCALGVLPGGSTNVFARTIGMPDDPLEAARCMLDALAAGSIRPAGLGFTNGRCFLFHCGAGLDASVVALAERHPTLKQFGGHSWYLAAALWTWMRWAWTRPPTRRDGFLSLCAGRPGRAPATDDRTSDRADPQPIFEAEGCHFVLIANTDPFTYLGDRPISLAPQAGLDNGLSVVALRTLRPSALAPLLRDVLSGNGLAHDADAATVARCDDLTWVTVTADSATDGQRSAAAQHRPLRQALNRRDGHREDRRDDRRAGRQADGRFDYQADGDPLGRVGAIRCDWAPEMLRLVIPPDGPSHRAAR